MVQPIFLYVVFFILGLVFGSFFNVVGIRVPLRGFLQHTRSICPHCLHTLSWYELIPVLSYFLQLAKCRQCSQPISPLYPIVECSTAILFTVSFHHFGLSGSFLLSLLFTSLLMIIIVTDLYYMLIPDKILLLFTPFLFLLRLIETSIPWYEVLFGGLFGLVSLAIIILLSGGGIGAGDMKLIGVMGIVIGWQGVLLTLCIAALLGVVVGYCLIMAKVTRRQQPIPFAPFLAVAALISLFWGEDIIQTYFTLWKSAFLFFCR